VSAPAALAGARQRLVVVSNRLPIILSRDAAGALVATPGAGGLVTSLAPVLRHRGGVWVGWAGLPGDDPALQQAVAGAPGHAGYDVATVPLSEEEQAGFYHGFSNEVLWPLFHSLDAACNFDPAYWTSYCTVNRRYAQVVAEHARSDDFVWVHDYQLLLVGGALRDLGWTAPMAFFLHIPFPPLEGFLRLPWRFQVLRSLLAYDLVGFQTVQDRRNFITCVRTLLRGGVRLSAGGQRVELPDGHVVRIGTFPIGIDAMAYERQAASAEVGALAAALHAQLPDRQLILGVDRLDYTKGIPERLEAFRLALRRFPELHRRVTLIQVVVPSRADIGSYHDLKERIDRLVGEINGEFTHPGGWVPIHYVFRPLPRADLLAYYRACEVALITPLRDGMNLVAKEYCACTANGDGVLILSEFAGAAAQLQRGALLVNPYDVERVATAIHQAVTMPLSERRTRMRRLRRVVRSQDVFWWVESFLGAAFARDLAAFPHPADYVPREEAELVFWGGEPD
jgi:trehalose 6-phosphate synthase/phosphatase